VSEWQNTPIKNLCSKITSGGTPSTKQTDYYGGDIPWLNTKEINFKAIHKTEKTISELGLKNSSAKWIDANSVVVAMYGATAGKSAITKIPVTTNQACCNLTINEKLADYRYVYYSLVDSYSELENLASGAAQQNLNVGVISNFEISTPDLPEQKAIASVLSSLDDKIDLLHRQNTTLERMAETLFRQWFVEEVQEDWPRKPLGEFVTIKRGGSPRPIQEFLSESGYRWLKISDVTSLNSPFIFDIKEHIKVEGLRKTVLLNAGSLVLSNSATPGIPKILTIDSCIHDGWLHFPKSYFSNEFLYLLFNHIRPELISHGNGSIFTNLKTDILKEFVIPIPNETDLKVFQSQIKSIFDKLLSNAKQIQTLEKLRDNLLPKLMSGEVRVDLELVGWAEKPNTQ